MNLLQNLLTSLQKPHEVLSKTTRGFEQNYTRFLVKPRVVFSESILLYLYIFKKDMGEKTFWDYNTTIFSLIATI